MSFHPTLIIFLLPKMAHIRIPCRIVRQIIPAAKVAIGGTGLPEQNQRVQAEPMDTAQRLLIPAIINHTRTECPLSPLIDGPVRFKPFFSTLRPLRMADVIHVYCYSRY